MTSRLLAAFLACSSALFCGSAKADCGSTLSQVAPLVASYFQAAAENDSARSDQVYGHLHELIFSESDLSCRDELLTEYFIDSVTSGGKYPIEKRGQVFTLFAEASEISELVRGLHEKGKIRFLTDEFRGSHGKGWSEKLNADLYAAIGGYDCGSSTVYLDPTLRPLDAAIVVFHELDHFVHDKTTHSISPSFVSGGKVNWDAYNLDDEFSAISFSAAAQGDLQENYSTALPKRSKPFHISGDFSLFSNDGPYSKLFHLNGVHCGIGSYLMIPLGPGSISDLCQWTDPGRIVESDTMFADRIYRTDLGTDKYQKQIRKHADGIRHRIWEAYFAEGTYPSAVFESTPQHTGSNLTELKSSDVGTLLKTADAPSPVCSDYIKSLRETPTTVQNYLGTDFLTDDGSTAASVRPCLRSKTGW